MNRRGFLSGFLKGAVAIAAAPQIVSHGLHLRKRLVEPVRIVMGPNPDYVDAPYEISFYFDQDAMDLYIVNGAPINPTKPSEICPSQHKDAYPLRFRKATDTIPVPPFILLPA